MAYVFGSPFDKKRIVRGTLPKNKNRFIVKASLPQPEEILAADFINSLAETGVFVSGEIKFEKTDRNKFKGIYTHTSPGLMNMVKVINHKSVNLFAEHYVRQIAYEQTGYGSREKGLEIISQFWFSKQIPGEHFFMEDGSGLSHFNAISPVQLNFILNYMFNNSASGLNFQNTFPSAGFGTLSSFSTAFFHDNSLQAKSGSMTRVRCYSGYLTTESKKKIAFSVMVNHFNGSGSKLSKEIENLLQIVKFN